MVRVKIAVAGIVQGVGFRPFVYRLAQKMHLNGFVLNHSGGVTIEIEGQSEKVTQFLQSLRTEAPPLSLLDSVTVTEIASLGDTGFAIKTSQDISQHTALVSPDVAICDDCLQEMLDPSDRRYRYPFINCTNCGPRYTIIKDIPYDRPKTTMEKFPMCQLCLGEYQDPVNRRFHAQPNACRECGPKYFLVDNKGRQVNTDVDVFVFTRQLISEGAVMAIKGIGGFHLACNAKDNMAVNNLRKRKIREDKPFAVMCGSEQQVCQLAQVSPEEKELLISIARPIVVLEKNSNYNLADAVAPRNPCIGVMLPYAPVHYLLLDKDDVWVMTSGNVSDEPIAYEDEDCLTKLSGIADYFLVHNRPIHRRADDSVVRIFQHAPYFIRRSRGYVPRPISIAGSSSKMPSVLACGGELKNTFCLTRNNQAFLSTHIGDLENMSTFEYYKSTIDHFERLLDTKPQVIAYDMHPDYLSTQYALTLDIPKIAVQHHHAHIASVLAEYGIQEKVIGIAFDGTGYGDDGKLWGGEFLVADRSCYERAAHVKYMPLPGGQKAIKEPWRLALYMLYNLYGKNFENKAICQRMQFPVGWQLLLEAIDKKFAFPLTSSAGRLFDTAAALLGVRQFVNYEGQAAIELELAADSNAKDGLPYQVLSGHPYILDFDSTFMALIDAAEHGGSTAKLAAAFHFTIALAVQDVALKIRQDTGIKKVVLSGGVWQNRILLQQVISLLEKAEFIVYLNRLVPTNDGGICLGQAVIAWERWK